MVTNKLTQWYVGFIHSLKEFIHDQANRFPYQLVDIKEQAGESKRIVIRVTNRRFSFEQPLQQIVLDDNIIESMAPKQVRLLTFLAVMEKCQSNYKIIAQKVQDDSDDYQLEIYSKATGQTIYLKASEISKNKSLLSQFDAMESHHIGYLYGSAQTAKEFRSLKACTSHEQNKSI